MAISTVNQKGLDAPLTLSSPVLTTPNLGTPSSLVLTNATGTPASINLSNATALPSGALPSGVVKQVVSYEYTGTDNLYTNNTSVATTIAATITPSSSSSRIVILGRIACSGTAGFEGGGFYIRRNSTSLNNASGGSQTNGSYSMGYWNPPIVGSNGNYDCTEVPIAYVDSPASTSALTYTIMAQGVPGANNILVNMSNNGYIKCTSQIILMEIA